MADYYTVLNKVIAALAENSGEARRLVYDRARKALVRQLKAIDPPLSPSDVTRQRLSLEKSIRRVETEQANQTFGLPSFPAATRPEEAPAPPPRQARPEEPAPPVAPSRPRVSASPPPARQASVAARDAIDPAAGPGAAARVEPSINSGREIPADKASTVGAPGPDQTSPAQVSGARVEPSLGAEPGPAWGQPLDKDPGLAAALNSARKLPFAPVYHIIGGGVAGLIVVAAIVVWLAGGQGGFDPGFGEPRVASTDGDAEGPKTTGQPVGTATGRVAPDATRVRTRVVQDDSGEPLASLGVPVAQRAVLYEKSDDPTLNNAIAVAGEVIWREGADAVEGSKFAAVDVRFPERDFSMSMVLRENLGQVDEASNIFEITFQLPDDYNGGSVAEISGLFMKSAEDARGDLLIGSGVRIANNEFWLALSGSAANRRLLSEHQWIEVPLKFANGLRGWIMFEKGTDGNRVVDSVIKTWRPVEGTTQ